MDRDYDLHRVGDPSTFYAWHLADPVDDRERLRNDSIEYDQHNRNPFVDFPELVLDAWPAINLDRARDVLDTMGIDEALLDEPITDAVAEKPIEHIRIHSLNIGAGSCHLVECPGNTAPILYDCGAMHPSPPDMTHQAEVVNYVTTILDRYADDPILVLSHGDEDHYKYVPAIMEGRQAGTIWFGDHRQSYPAYVRNLFARHEANKIEVMGGLDELPAGFSNGGAPVPQLRCGDADTYVLTVNSGSTKNSRSLLLRIVYGDFSVTLTGDATSESQNSARNNFTDLDSTVVMGSHHGATSHGSNNSTWASATRPEIVVFSAGTSHKHPRCNAMNEYRDSLESVGSHPIWCGSSSNYGPEFETTRAEYVTRTNGGCPVRC